MASYLKDCTIIISSCDKYSDLWAPCVKTYEKFWPDCPYKILLITESSVLESSCVESLQLGSNDWSTLLLLALDRVKTDVVLLTLDDFFLKDTVENSLIEKLLYDFINYNYKMLRLIPRPGPDFSSDRSQLYGKIKDNARYKVSTQASFWSKDALRSVLRPGESPWEFETNGSERAKNLSDFYSTYHVSFPYYHHVVERGKWFPWEVRRFKNFGINIDLSAREIMSATETILWVLKKFISHVFNKLSK